MSTQQSNIQNELTTLQKQGLVKAAKEKAAAEAAAASATATQSAVKSGAKSGAKTAAKPGANSAGIPPRQNGFNRYFINLKQTKGKNGTFNSKISGVQKATEGGRRKRTHRNRTHRNRKHKHRTHRKHKRSHRSRR